jgi:hypothetical protein
MEHETEKPERLESDRSARNEARSIIQAMKRGVNMSDVFRIPPATQLLLDEFSAGDSIAAGVVRNSLAYRQVVKDYVRRLLSGEEIGPYEEEQDSEEEESDGTETAVAPDSAPTASWGCTQVAEEPASAEAEA